MPDLVPNYTTTKADGTVGALFTGGIQIPAGTNQGVPAQHVEWIRQSDGGLIAYEWAFDALTAIQAGYRLQDPAIPTNFAQLLFSGRKSGTTPFSVNASVAGSQNPGGVEQGALLIDEQGNSAFPFLAAGLARRVVMNFGINNVTWPGGSVLNTALTVAHGLGKTPVAVVATMQASGQGQVLACHTGNYTANNFDVQAQYVQGFVPGAGATLPVVWIAIG